MSNSFAQIPVFFDVVRLMDDLRICQQIPWIQHFNQNDYEGSWESIALRSASANEEDILSHPTEKGYKNTRLLEKCSYFKEVLRFFQCELESVRLLSLKRGSCIKEHRDIKTGYQYGFFRLHIPLQTEEKIVFKVAGYEIKMKAGECWYANFDLPHSVKNEGTMDRIHLIVDAKRNAWSDELFLRAGYDFDFEKRNQDYDKETKIKMITQLKKMHTVTASELICRLEKEIKES